MQAEADEALAKEQLISEITRKQSHLKAETLKKRLGLRGAAPRVRQAIDRGADFACSRLPSIRRARCPIFRQSRLESLEGHAWLLRRAAAGAGRSRSAGGTGQNLARVADPSRLKAELKIAETQAKDIEVGQSAEIDTRNGVIPGKVSRKDPAAANGTVTIDVSLTGELPARARCPT